MLMLDSLESLAKSFGQIAFRPKKIGLFKILIPFFYEDGDMYDIFIEESPMDSSLLRVSDYGLTLMKLSYTFDINTSHKNEILESIVLQNRCCIANGNIYLDILPEQFQAGVYQFIQTITKVSNMDIISRESMKSYFYEFLDSFIREELSKSYTIHKDVSPTSNHGLLVDYEIAARRPIYLFGVNDDSKASKVLVSCLNFQKENLAFRSLVVHENFEELSKFNRSQLIDVADKQFTSIDAFRDSGSSYIQRELSA